MALLHCMSIYTGTVTSINPSKTTIYTVPAGYRIILRSIAMRNLNSASQQTCYVFVNGALAVSRLCDPGPQNGGSFEWRPWVVLEPGWLLQVAVTLSTGFSIVASGSHYTI